MNEPTPPVFLHQHELDALPKAPLSPEAVAQMVADLSFTNGKDGEISMLYRCEIADAITTLVAENATLRAERNAWTKIDVARDVEFATLRSENDIWTAEVVSWKMVVEAIERDVDREYKRAETAEAELATLRASEAAALERVKVLEDALEVYEDALTEAEAIFGGEYGDHYGPMCEMAFAARDARLAALTPTADKE